MIKNFQILCTILARGGSKGVKNKNIRLLNGIPLIAHTIIQAQSSGLFNKIVVSSDSSVILDVAEEYKVDLVINRPADLALDESPKLPAVQHAVYTTENYFNNEFEIIVDLDPTSPLREVEDIIKACQYLIEQDATNVITACPSRKSPYFNMVEIDVNNVAKLSKHFSGSIPGRQRAPKCFDMNASIYVWWRKNLLSETSIWQDKTRLFVMPEERSVDIDTELDFEFVSFLLAHNKKQRSI